MDIGNERKWDFADPAAARRKGVPADEYDDPYENLYAFQIMAWGKYHSNVVFFHCYGDGAKISGTDIINSIKSKHGF